MNFNTYLKHLICFAFRLRVMFYRRYTTLNSKMDEFLTLFISNVKAIKENISTDELISRLNLKL